MAQPEEKIIQLYPSVPEHPVEEPRGFWAPLQDLRDNPFFWFGYGLAIGISIWLVIVTPEQDRIQVYRMLGMYLFHFPVLVLWMAAIGRLWQRKDPLDWGELFSNPYYMIVLPLYGMVASLVLVGIIARILKQLQYAGFELVAVSILTCVFAGLAITLAELQATKVQ